MALSPPGQSTAEGAIHPPALADCADGQPGAARPVGARGPAPNAVVFYGLIGQSSSAAVTNHGERRRRRRFPGFRSSSALESDSPSLRRFPRASSSSSACDHLPVLLGPSSFSIAFKPPQKNEGEAGEEQPELLVLHRVPKLVRPRNAAAIGRYTRSRRRTQQPRTQQGLCKSDFVIYAAISSNLLIAVAKWVRGPFRKAVSLDTREHCTRSAVQRRSL